MLHRQLAMKDNSNSPQLQRHRLDLGCLILRYRTSVSPHREGGRFEQPDELSTALHTRLINPLLHSKALILLPLLPWDNFFVLSGTVQSIVCNKREDLLG